MAPNGGNGKDKKSSSDTTPFKSAGSLIGKLVKKSSDAEEVMRMVSAASPPPVQTYSPSKRGGVHDSKVPVLAVPVVASAEVFASFATSKLKETTDQVIPSSIFAEDAPIQVALVLRDSFHLHPYLSVTKDCSLNGRFLLPKGFRFSEREKFEEKLQVKFYMLFPFSILTYYVLIHTFVISQEFNLDFDIDTLLRGICVPPLAKGEKLWFHFGTADATQKLHFSKMFKETTQILRETEEVAHPDRAKKDVRRVIVANSVFVSEEQLLQLERASASYHTQKYDENIKKVEDPTD
jgi:hypothetical protein